MAKGKFYRMSKEDFRAERDRHAAYWQEHLEHSFRLPFSWTDHIKNTVYRRNFVEQPKPIINFSAFISD